MQIVRRVSVAGAPVVRRVVEDMRYPIVFELLEPRLMRDGDGRLSMDDVVGLVPMPTLVVDEDDAAPSSEPAIDPFDPLDLGDVESAMGVAVQADGKVIVFGFGGYANPRQGEQLADKLILARYNVDGTLDASFGTESGYSLVEAEGYTSYGSDVVIAADGSIWVATTESMATLLKFSPDGRSHQVVPGVPASQIALQADGKVVYVGQRVVGRLNADGSADTTFGTGGVVTLSADQIGSVNDVAVDAQGRIVIAGYLHHHGSDHDEPASTGTVIRLNSDGTLDATFADGGIFRLAAEGRRHEQFESLVVRADGRIAIGGQLFKQWLDESGFSYKSTGTWVLVQLNENGTLDTNFAGDGVRWSASGPFGSIDDLRETPDGRLVGAVYTGMTIAVAVFDEDGNHLVLRGGGAGGFPIYTTNLAVAPDGSVVAVGHVSIQDAGGSRVAAKAAAHLFATRFRLPEGPIPQQPDEPTDGPERPIPVPPESRPRVVEPAIPGMQRFDPLNLGDVESAMGVAVQPDGKVIVFGFGGYLVPQQVMQVADQLIVARYNPDGTLDTSFGTEGGYSIVEAPATHASYGSDVLIGPDGSIWVSTTESLGWLLKFSADGRSHQVIQNVGATDIALQPDGKVVYAGNSTIGRLNADGSVDMTFGVEGMAALPADTYLRDITVDADGRILAAGARRHHTSEHDTPAHTGLVMRLSADGTLDGSFADGGIFLLATDGRRHETFHSVIVRADGSIIAAGDLFKQWRNPDPNGFEYKSDSGALLVALREDGSLDRDFSGNGARWMNEDGDVSVIYELREMADGRLAAAIYSGTNPAVAIFDEYGGDIAVLGGGESVQNMPIWTTNVAVAPDGTIVTASHISLQDYGHARGQAVAWSDVEVTRFTPPAWAAPQPPEQEESPPPPPSSEEEVGQPAPIAGRMGGGAWNDWLLGEWFGLFGDHETDDSDGDEDEEEDALHIL